MIIKDCKTHFDTAAVTIPAKLNGADQAITELEIQEKTLLHRVITAGGTTVNRGVYTALVVDLRVRKQSEKITFAWRTSQSILRFGI